MLSLYIAAAIGGMAPSFRVRDNSTNVPGARFARFYDAPKKPTPKVVTPFIETSAQRKKRRAKLRRVFG